MMLQPDINCCVIRTDGRREIMNAMEMLLKKQMKLDSLVESMKINIDSLSNDVGEISAITTQERSRLTNSLGITVRIMKNVSDGIKGAQELVPKFKHIIDPQLNEIKKIVDDVKSKMKLISPTSKVPKPTSSSKVTKEKEKGDGRKVSPVSYSKRGDRQSEKTPSKDEWAEFVEKYEDALKMGERKSQLKKSHRFRPHS